MFQARLIIWSDIGHTPLTGRVGAFCDELLNEEIIVADKASAVDVAKSALANTRYGVLAHVAIPGLPNQNDRSIWVRESYPDPRGA